MTSYLPSVEEASALEFSALAKLLRSFLRDSPLLIERHLVFEQLVEVLESKLRCSDQRDKDAAKPVFPSFVYPSDPLPPSDNPTQRLVTELKRELKKQRSGFITKLRSASAVSELDVCASEIQKVISVRPRRWTTIDVNRGYMERWFTTYQASLRAFVSDWRLFLIGQLLKKESNDSSAFKGRSRLIASLKRDYAALIAGFFPPSKLPWVLLPAGEDFLPRLSSYINDFQDRHPHLRAQIERITFAYSLKPTHAYIGKNEFEGYLAFTFDHQSAVLLEHPFEGNAAYVFYSDWRILSRLSKAQLLSAHSLSVRRIIHRERGNWRTRIRALLTYKC